MGESDNNSDLGTFRTTSLAMEQGVHRLERGTTFFNENKALKNKNNWIFNWEMDTVKHVCHDYRKMSVNAIQWLKN